MVNIIMVTGYNNTIYSQKIYNEALTKNYRSKFIRYSLDINYLDYIKQLINDNYDYIIIDNVLDLEKFNNTKISLILLSTEGPKNITNVDNVYNINDKSDIIYQDVDYIFK